MNKKVLSTLFILIILMIPITAAAQGFDWDQSVTKDDVIAKPNEFTYFIFENVVPIFAMLTAIIVGAYMLKADEQAPRKLKWWFGGLLFLSVALKLILLILRTN